VNASSRNTLLAVGACALGVAGALGWATWHALRLERSELEAQARAEFQSSIRVALWRMDAALTPILARETARPYFHYSAFYPSERGYTTMLEDVEPGEHLVPSPLLTMDQQFVRLYFQRSASGEVTSPQVPSGNVRDLVESSLVGGERVVEAEARLTELGRILAASARVPLAAASVNERSERGPTAELGGAVVASGYTRDASLDAAQKPTEPLSQQIAQSDERLLREFDARQQAAGRAVQIEKQANSLESRAAPKRAGGKDAGEREENKNEFAGGREATNATRDLAAGDQARMPTAVPVAPSAMPASGGESAPAVELVAKSAAKDEGFIAKPDGVYRAAVDASPTDRMDEQKRLRESASLGFMERDDVSAVTRSDVDGSGAIEQGDMAPTWRLVNGSGEPQLLLVRTVRVGERRFEQGCWLDWPALNVWLAGNVQDLLPGANLRPVTDPYAQADPEALGRRLAGISAELDAEPTAVLAGPGWTPMRTTLVFTWGAVVLSFGAIGAALIAARDLAERRGQFVSAVTHELRTPLTTFCLYSQMLADGMVTEEGAKREYLGTLRRESDRLTKIVENVLEYARLGRADRGAAVRRTERLGELMERIVPTLRGRAAQSGVVLSAPDRLEENVGSMVVEVDAVSVERILVNLVDNACKYAPGSLLTVSVRGAGSDVEIDVEDFGPGIPGEQRGRLFQPFERGRSLAHATTPGLGLGLALSRTMARRMGGDLRLTKSSPGGSVFTLRVPKADGCPSA